MPEAISHCLESLSILAVFKALGKVRGNDKEDTYVGNTTILREIRKLVKVALYSGYTNS